MPDRIGPYEVARELGRGGMGVVYLGRDTRLDRPVAIKALPEALAQDPERLARFEREARTLAQLSHPNIAGIHGVEHQDDNRYLVLEFIEGETLADRLDRGPLQPDEAIEFAAQIAQGLEAAHDAAVIHRDLKPANVIITPEGRAVLLDFGLARVDESGSSSGPSESLTLTTPAQHSPTIPGAIMGTAAYMSPEQARGRRVDKRADIWSFGVMLYEMLTGASPFVGETVSDSIGAILHKPIDLDRLPPNTPPQIARVIRRCVERDKNNRYRDIGDARLDLTTPEPFTPTTQTTKTAPFPILTTAAMAILLAAAAAIAAWFLSPQPTPAPLHLAVPAAIVDKLDGPGPMLPFSIHPTEPRIAYIAADPADRTEDPTVAIYIRDFNDPRPRKVPGTDNAVRVTYSPDGQSLLYFWDDPEASRWEIRRTTETGPSIRLFEDPSLIRLSYAPTWVGNNTTAFVGDDLYTIYLADASGGLPEPTFVMPEIVEDFLFVMDLWATPDGQYLYVSGYRTNADTGLSADTVVEFNIETKEHRLLDISGLVFRVVNNDIATFFNPDQILFAARWDPEARQLTSEPRPVTADIAGNRAAVSISANGSIAYSTTPGGAPRSHIMSIDKAGTVETITQSRANFGPDLAVSPDGKTIAVTMLSQDGASVHLVDVATGIARIAVSRGFSISPSFLPDGRLAVNQLKSIAEQVPAIADPNDPSKEPTPLTQHPIADFVRFSSDGRYAMGIVTKPPSLIGDIVFIDMQTDERHDMITTEANERSPVLSPNDTLLAYGSDSTGEYRYEIRPVDLETLAFTAPPTIVPGLANRAPFWAPDGSALYHLNRSATTLISIPVTQSQDNPADFTMGEPTPVFTNTQAPFETGFGTYPILPSPDGQRFYFVEATEPPTQPQHINLILNWYQELDQLLPRN